MPRARKYDGVVYPAAWHLDLVDPVWERNGVPQRESSLTADWQEANKRLEKDFSPGMTTSSKSDVRARP